jgi:hypothetical protein
MYYRDEIPILFIDNLIEKLSKTNKYTIYFKQAKTSLEAMSFNGYEQDLWCESVLDLNPSSYISYETLFKNLPYLCHCF